MHVMLPHVFLGARSLNDVISFLPSEFVLVVERVPGKKGPREEGGVGNLLQQSWDRDSSFLAC